MKQFITTSLILKNISSFIAACIGFIIIHLYTRHGGIGISPDSIMYTSVARNMNEGKWLIQFDHTPLVLFPAFYPGFLGCILFITGKDVLAFAPVLNGLLFALIIFLSGWIMDRFNYKNKWYKWIILLCIATSPCLIEIYSMLWSETLFIVLSILFMLAIKQYFKKHTLTALLPVAIITAFACVTRYAGVTLIVIGGTLLLFDKQLEWRRKITHLFIFGIIGISLLATNLIRNSIITGLSTGRRQQSLTSLHDNIQYFGTVLCDWFPFLKGHYSFAFIIACSVLLVFTVALLYRSFTFTSYYSYENIATVFLVMYEWFIIISSTVSRYEQINNRLLAPVFIPLIFSLTYRIPQWINQSKNTINRIILITVSILLATTCLTSQTLLNKETFKNVDEGGIGGYTDDSWVYSPILQFLKTHKELLQQQNIPAFSNAGQAIYLYTGVGIKNLPERVHYNLVDELFARKNFNLVWFNYEDNFDLLSIKEIAAKKKLTALNSFEDGVIYSCTSDSITLK